VNLRLGYMTGQYPRVTDTFIQREVLALRARGHHVQTFAVRAPAQSLQISLGIAEERRSTIYLLPPRRLMRAHLRAFLASPTRYGKAIGLAWRTCPPGFVATIKQFAYFMEAGLLAARMHELSLSHLHNHFADSSCSVAAIAAEIGGFSFSFTIHGPAEFFEMSRWWLGEKVRRALFVVCISSFCRSQMMVAAAVEDWSKLRIVHCGVDPKLFDVKKHEKRGRRLLFVGRLAPEKGCAVLLNAIAQLPDVTLDVVGDGAALGSLRKHATALGIADRVVFYGYLSENRVRDRLAEADVFVLTSFAEGVPVVLMEALAAGVPAVATAIAGIPELIEDGVTGILVPPSEPEATAEALRKLLDDPGLRNRIGEAGRKKVEREFNLDAECDRLANMMMAALAERRQTVRDDANCPPNQ
jgi:colanic acid/amylovoran biosynthesis glycosyltransferase